MILMVISFLLSLSSLARFLYTQIIFDGFTVGRYDEGLDDNDEATDTSLMSASGSEACKFLSLVHIDFTTITRFLLFSPLFLSLSTRS